jgi:hypothetical protein
VLHDQVARMKDQPMSWPKVSTEAPKEAAAKAWIAALT